MSLDINRYTLKCWIKFAYGLKPNVDFVVSYIWGELDDYIPESQVDEILEQSIESLTSKHGADYIQRYEQNLNAIKLNLKHYSWNIFLEEDRFWITLDGTPYNDMWKGPIETLVEFLIELDKLVPFIIEQCEEIEAEKRKKQILSDITAATARGIIEGLVSQGLIDIPKGYVIRGTDIGRVLLYFNSPKCTINTPLDYLRARLTRRFPNRCIPEKQHNHK